MDEVLRMTTFETASLIAQLTSIASNQISTFLSLVLAVIEQRLIQMRLPVLLLSLMVLPCKTSLKFDHTTESHETPMNNESPDSPMDDKSPDSPMDETSPDSPMDDTSPDSPMDDKSPDSPMDDKSPDSPMDDTSPDSPMDDTSPDSAIERHVSQAELEEADVDMRPDNSKGQSLLYSEDEKKEEISLGKATSTKETTEDEHFEKQQRPQVTGEMSGFQLDVAKQSCMFIATQIQASTSEENDSYEIELYEELDKATDALDSAIKLSGLKPMNRSQITTSIGQIEDLPFKDTFEVLSSDQFTVFLMTPTTEIPFLKQLEEETSVSWPLLIKVLVGQPCFVYLDPTRHRFCVIFSLSMSELTPSSFKWFFQEVLKSVFSEVITFCLNKAKEVCFSTCKQDFLSYVISLSLMICYILSIPILDYILSHVDLIEMKQKTHKLMGSEMASEVTKFLETLQQIREKGHCFILKGQQQKKTSNLQSEEPTRELKLNKQQKDYSRPIRQWNYIVGKLHGQNVTDFDITSLTKKNFLTDRILDAILLGMANEHDVYHVNSASWTSILLGQAVHLPMKHTELKFLSFNKIIGVIHVNQNHWIFVGVNVRERSLVVLNPLGRSMDSKEQLILENWRAYLKARISIGYEDDATIDWKHFKALPDKQKDGHNCGIFCLMYAEHFLKDWSFQNLDHPFKKRNKLHKQVRDSIVELSAASCIVCGEEDRNAMDTCQRCNSKNCHNRCRKEDEREQAFTCFDCCNRPIRP